MRATIEGVILRHTYRSSLCATASLCMVPLVVNSSISLTSLYYPDQYTRKKHKTSPKLISEVFMVEVLLGLTDNIFLLFVYIASLKTYGRHKHTNKFRYDNKSMQNNCISYLESF